MDYYQSLHNKRRHQVVPPHYYGDTIRVIYVIAGIFMIISFPFFADLLGLPIIIPLFAVLALGVFGGLMNPKQKWVMYANMFISILALLVFEYYAVTTYLGGVRGAGPLFFWGNQILALLFFVSTYLSVKTVRGMILNKK